MKKFISGLVVGVILATTFSAFAANPLIGKQVEETFPLIIDGKRAAKDVIALEGTSYLPIRAAGEMFGYDVDFVNQEVMLSKKGSDDVPEQNIADQIFKEAKEYPVKTNIGDLVLWDDNNYKYLVLDGEGYIHIRVFGKYANYVNQNIVVRFPDKEYTIFVGQNYQTGVDGFLNKNGTFVKLSTLGLKASIRDNTIWIEKL